MVSLRYASKAFPAFILQSVDKDDLWGSFMPMQALSGGLLKCMVYSGDGENRGFFSPIAKYFSCTPDVHCGWAKGTRYSLKADLPEGFSVTQPLSECNTF